MDYLVWAAVLLCIGLALAVLEVFVPSSGLLGFLSIMSVVGAIFMAFRYGRGRGSAFWGWPSSRVPAGLLFALQLWPRTPMGRRILLPLPRSDEVLPDNDRRRSLKTLVGKLGRARSLMLPSGAVEIDGVTVDALSEGMAIEAGAWVKVIEVRGTRVVVRPTDERPAAEPRPEVLEQTVGRSLRRSPFLTLTYAVSVTPRARSAFLAATINHRPVAVRGGHRRATHSDSRNCAIWCFSPRI